MIRDEIVTDIAKYCVLRKISHRAFGKEHLKIKRKIKTILLKKTSKYFSLDDINKLLTFFFMNGRGFDYEKWKTIYYFIYYTGITRYEILNLKREDVNLINCSISLKIANWRTPRTIFYPEKIRDLIIKYFNRIPEEKNAFNVTSFKFDWQTRRLKNKLLRGKRFNYASLRNSNDGLLTREGFSKRITRYLKFGDVENINLEEVEKEYRERIG